jgi:1,4-dihydroxy-2-naphthoate polyprenyltransferase
MLSLWWISTRPKTLIASLSPVLIGHSLIFFKSNFSPAFFILIALTALCIQIATNFANDYFDGKKGTDTAERKGLKRPLQLGQVSYLQMRHALFVTCAIAVFSSIPLILKGGCLIAGIAAFSLLLAFLYTATPWALSYRGTSDLFAFLFFGPLATATTVYLQTGLWLQKAWIVGLGSGALSAALLAANNLRDREEDGAAQKKTLCVRFGMTFGRALYTGWIVLSLLTFGLYGERWVTCVLSALALLLLHRAWRIQKAALFNSLLAQTGLFLWIYTAAFCLQLIYAEIT